MNKALKETFNNDTQASENEDDWDYRGKKQYKIYQDGKVEEIEEGQIILPSGYQKVEYIESTGTQFINTEIYPKSTTKVIFDFVYTGEENGGN